MGNEYPGTLVAVEGLDGSGKSTVVDEIDKLFNDVVCTSEPTTKWVDDITAVADFFYFCADRRQHIEFIEKELRKENVVVTDRYVDSTRAYQTHKIAEEMDMGYDEARRWMESVFEPWLIEPDVTIYISISVDTSTRRTTDGDKYENRENLQRVKEAYDTMYSHCDGGVRIIDGHQSKTGIKHTVINTIKALCHEPGDGEKYSGGKTYAEAVLEEE